jgi:Flp pilus assembly protein protease CpaA
MVIQFLSLATAFIGSSLAAAYDLKTTEIPDEIPYAMIAIALILYGIQSLSEWNYLPILKSLIAGLGLLGFGFIMYFFGQWGGGDAKVLSAIGFLIPSLEGYRLLFPFPVSYLINVFLVGAPYMVLYAIVFAILNKKILSEFFKDIKRSKNVMLIGSLSLYPIFILLNLFLMGRFQADVNFLTILANSTLILVLTVSLFLLWRFVKVVDNIGFRKKIPVSKLKVGDMLLESKLLEGIDEKALKKIKKSGKKYVWIKEGVRFALAFLLTLLFILLTLLFILYFGDGIYFLTRLLI